MPKRKDLKKIAIIGSGPIVIGQACEFDYSGSQAAQVLNEEGYEVVIINPNPASFMTSGWLPATVYSEPLTMDFLHTIFKKERPDALLATMGGQTALNVSLDLHRQEILEEFGIELIGANPEAIHVAEDRGAFRQLMIDSGFEVPHAYYAKTVKEAHEAAERIGFPLIIRPSFTLGGLGGRTVKKSSELHEFVREALHTSPNQSLLIEESLDGWREFEMEVIRDSKDNAVVVCSIENVDPMGVHTGDSITVAPVQTLSDTEYQRMRSASIEILRRVGVDCGGSNVQFTFNDDCSRMLVIEMNPRVSRSSALASKATGFPIARIAARIAVGYTLDEIQNEMTKKTYACFEPALDYCVVKVPRFDVAKFADDSFSLSTEMKSVGESFAIGRNFIEALNKAIRSNDAGYDGLTQLSDKFDVLFTKIQNKHPMYIHALYSLCCRLGISAHNELSQLSGVHPWFLHAIGEQATLLENLTKKPLSKELLYAAKRYGISDAVIASTCEMEEPEVFLQRKKQGLHASYYVIDTCAGEFEATTPYYYGTIGEHTENAPLSEQSVVILGSGPNRIGQGLEFDTSCSLAALSLRKHNTPVILINNNPETVSTDFNIADRLYIASIDLEEIREVLLQEPCRGVIVQLGGQAALNMAPAIESLGIPILGTSTADIARSEDRASFRALLDSLFLHQPKNSVVMDVVDLVDHAKAIGFPVLLRPSFVLGGRAMRIAYTELELHSYVNEDITVSTTSPLLIEQYLEHAEEIDIDVVSDGENVYIAGILQHIEPAGIHSGDSACTMPPYDMPEDTLNELIRVTALLVRSLSIKGFCNIQCAVQDGKVYVIEINPRASRTVPYISTVTGVPLVELASRVWLGESLADTPYIGSDGIGVGKSRFASTVKEAVFSFSRFRWIDPVLGPEMRSTGESIGIGDSFGEAFAKASMSAGTHLPISGRAFLSIGEDMFSAVFPSLVKLHQLGFSISTGRTLAQMLLEKGMLVDVMFSSEESKPNVLDYIQHDRIQLVVNLPIPMKEHRDSVISREALRHGIPYITTAKGFAAAVEAITYLQSKDKSVKAIAGVS